MPTKISSRGMDVPRYIAERKDFQTYGALRGGTYWRGAGWLPTNHQLPPEWRDRFMADTRNVHVYVVWSYETPIAWYTEAGWVVPPVKYSVTTSKHQGRLYLCR